MSIFKQGEFTRIKKATVNKFNFCFRQNGLVVISENDKNAQLETISYQQITSVIEMGSAAFFFKTNKFSYAFFFKGIETVKAEFLGYLKNLTSNASVVQDQIKAVDISIHFTPIILTEKRSHYTLSWESLKPAIDTNKPD